MAVNKMEKIEEESEEGEDWCFECYEGGDLVLCDHKNCVKSYHAKCVGKDESFFETENTWFCRRHSCSQCKKSSIYQCYGCPEGLCERCVHDIHFACIKGNKGICINCLKVTLLGEEGIDVDSDGECVDFKDLETTEGLFFDYWKKVVKKKEGLTVEDLQAADVQIKKGAKYKGGYKSKKLDNDYVFKSIASSDDDDDDGDGDHMVDDMDELRPKPSHKRKISCKQKLVMKRGRKSKRDIPKSKSEIVSWASNCVLGFLESVGEDTSKRLEPYQIASIIHRHAEENKLYHPEKPRKIVCDEKLKSLLGKKIVDKNKIVDLLEPHFPEFLESSGEEEEEEIRCSNEPIEKKPKVVSCKKKRYSVTHIILDEKEEAVVAPVSCFAFIVSENIKLVYLTRSLVQELLKNPETFESKVIGSFVRVKLESVAGSRRLSFHQLLPVTGINNLSKEKNNSEVLLQLSTLKKDIPINLLSDGNFSEEECEDLKKKVKDGLIRRPTIVELEQKAKTLHEDITIHSIVKELEILQHRIDRANEKGWKRELFDCYERQRVLQRPEERSRLLRKVPNVIPDLADDKPFITVKDDIQENEKEEKILQNSMVIKSPEPVIKDGSEEDEKREQITQKSDFGITNLSGSHEEKDGTSSGFISSNGKKRQKIFEKRQKEAEAVIENQLLFEEKEAKKINDTAKLVEEKNISENQINNAPQGCEIVPYVNENHNDYSTEMFFLEAMTQQCHYVAPQIEDSILFESEFFHNMPK